MIPSDIVFVDTELTGVDVRYHHVWEVCLLAADGAVLLNATAWTPAEHMDPNAQRVNRLFQRFPFFYVQEQCDPGRPRMFRPSTDSIPRAHLAKAVAQHTSGKVLAAACVGTDVTFLTKLLHEFDLCPAWDYHHVDVEALLAGRHGVAPPWKGRKLAEVAGVSLPDAEHAHTAWADALWHRRLYEVAMAPRAELHASPALAMALGTSPAAMTAAATAVAAASIEALEDGPEWSDLSLGHQGRIVADATDALAKHLL